MKSMQRTIPKFQVCLYVCLYVCQFSGHGHRMLKVSASFLPAQSSRVGISRI